MAMNPPSNSPSVVIDANVLIALCAKEVDKYPVALAQMQQYIHDGCVAYAPGVLVSEALYVLCSKLQNGFLTPVEHARSIQRLRVRMRGILPPPNGDAALVARAEQIRGGYGCSHSADGLYLALAEELAQSGVAELVTFDMGLQRQAATMTPTVTVRLLTP